MKPDETDLSFHDGHRGRLRQKFLDGHLADYELLELLLSYAIPRRDVRPLARGLVKQFGGIYQIISAPIDDLMKYRGVGQNTAIFLKAIAQLMIIGCKFQLTSGPIFHDDQALRNYCVLQLIGKTDEEFHVLYLDKNLRLLMDELHSTGSIDWSPVFPRKILKNALDLNARSVVLLHNHPTPHTTFSQQDAEITKTIQNILNQCEIELYDHFLVSGGILYSARNMFILK